MEGLTLTYDGPHHPRLQDDDTGKTFSLHRLAAVAKFGFDEVADKVVHHTSEEVQGTEKEFLVLMSKENHDLFTKVRGVEQKLNEDGVLSDRMLEEYAVTEGR